MLAKSELNQILAAYTQHKILVFGDLILDEYHWCQASRISPEAPVPICRVIETTLVPGGAANVAHNLVVCDNHPYLVGIIGQDSTGHKLLNKLELANIETEHILATAEKPTILKSRIVAHQQQVVRVDRENTSPLSLGSQRKIFASIKALMPTVDAVLISDYLKGTVTDSLCRKIIEVAREQRKSVIVDPKGDRYLKYKGATVLTPNMLEFETVTKKKITSEEEILVAGLRLIKKLDLQYLLITRSEKGMSLIFKTGQKIDLPTKAKEVFDTTGAGDTAISFLALGLASGCPVEKAAYIANYAAGIVVGKIGTSTVTRTELLKAMQKDAST